VKYPEEPAVDGWDPCLVMFMSIIVAMCRARW